MRSCDCSYPIPNENPRRLNVCVRCSGWINPAWTSNDKTTGAFYNDLRLSIPVPGDDYNVFRAQAEARELAGRRHFRHRHLGRDNLADACEEAADGANYLLFDSLQTLRERDIDDERALVLTGANHFYQAHKTARALRARRGGRP